MPGKMARSDPRPSVQVTRGAGSGQHLASVLQEGRGNANIDAGLGVIWRISADNCRRVVHRWNPFSAFLGRRASVDAGNASTANYKSLSLFPSRQ